MTVTIDSSDGTPLAIEEFGVNNRNVGRPSILFLPALGVPLSYYDKLLAVWGETRHVIGLELRPMGTRPTRELRAATFGYSALARNDVAAALAAEPLAGRSVVLVGHSLGGQLSLLATAAGIADPAAIVVIAAGTSSTRAQGTTFGRLRRGAGIGVVRATSRVLRYWPGHRLGFGGRQPASLMRDWGFEARHGRYRLHDDDFDYEAALPEIAAPVLLIGLEGDRLVTRRAVEHLMSRLPATTTFLELPSPDGRPSHHFRWARDVPASVIGRIESWLSESDDPRR